MSIGNLVLGVNSVTVSYLIRYESLLQNAADLITKCDSYFITKCVCLFITKCGSFISKCDSYYKLRRFYYKMRQLLQNATFIKNCDSTVHNQINFHYLKELLGLIYICVSTHVASLNSCKFTSLIGWLICVSDLLKLHFLVV